VDRVLFGFLAIFAVTSAFARTAAAPEVIFVSPCECQGFHGKNRWITKTDQSPVPLDKSAIQSVTPSQIYAWEGLEPNVVLTGTTEERMPAEQKWYALTGRPHRPILIARDGGGGGFTTRLRSPSAQSSSRRRSDFRCAAISGGSGILRRMMLWITRSFSVDHMME
jgi:hypothetical protein